MRGEAMDSVLLYQEEVDGDELRIEGVLSDGCVLEVVQESTGPFTSWCFEESPHVVQTVFGPDAVGGLLEYFHLEEVDQLLPMIRAAYVGCESALRLRGLARRLGLSYTVYENDIVR